MNREIVNNPSTHLVSGEEAKRLGTTISEVFFDVPMTVYLMPDTSKRRNQLEWFFSTIYRYCQRWGEVYADADLTAGSAWLLPGHNSMSTLNLLRIGFWQMPIKLGWSGSTRLMKPSDATEKVHKRVMPSPHRYLLTLGVTADSQGTGLGTALLNPETKRAGQSNLPVYRETMTEKNVDYYSKRGYVVAEEFVVDSQVRTWAMIK